MTRPETPHLNNEIEVYEDKPHVWIQWKGTDVCCDVHCACGELLHFDGDFFYTFQCPYCQQYFEVGTHIPIYKVTAAEAGDNVNLLKRDA